MKACYLGFALLFAASAVYGKDLAKKNSARNQSSVSNEENLSPGEESEAKPAKPKIRNGKKVVKLKSDEVLENSSEANRDGKVVSVTFELIGLAPLPVQGAALGYYLTANNVLELSHASGQSDFLIAKIDYSLTSLRLKTFWSNSFYTNIGLGSRMIEYRFQFSEIDNNGLSTNRTNATTMQNTSMGLDF
jgi:hypothetical protein